MVKIERNQPCPCGSGIKYKKCCFQNEEKNTRILKAAAKSTSCEDVYKRINTPPNVYHFKVTYEFAKDVWRIIEIKGNQTLHDLHMAIQNAFDWDNDHMYSFFLDNKYWSKAQEYSGNPFGEHTESLFSIISEEESKSASETEIGDLNLLKRKKIKYIFDYGDELRHQLELIDITHTIDANKKYPNILKVHGKAPEQYDKCDE